MHPVSCLNIHHDVTDLVNHEMVTNAKTCAYNINCVVPQMTHFEKLSFCSGENV